MSRRKVSTPPQHWQVKGLGSGSLGAGSPISPNMARTPVGSCAPRPFANRRGAAAKTQLDKASLHMKQSDNKKPMVIEVPPARIPEEPVAVIPHAGICEGGVGKPTSLP